MSKYFFNFYNNIIPASRKLTIINIDVKIIHAFNKSKDDFIPYRKVIIKLYSMQDVGGN